MNHYKIKLKHRKDVAANTTAFYFEKPQGFDFQPGQFLSIRLPDVSPARPGKGLYDFSIASAPHEEDLMIVTRMRESPFKTKLMTMSFDEEIQIEGPFGTMVLPEESDKHTVFLAGGIGIAPFRSMIHHAAHHALPHVITLFHANPTQEHAVFFDEFQTITRKKETIQFIPVITQPPEIGVGWGGETGYFTEEMLRRYIENHHNAVYYIVGPVKMVIGTKRMITSMGVANEDVKMEIFTGY